MRFRLGQKVYLSSSDMKYPAIIIATNIDTYLLGWERGHNAHPVAWQFTSKEKDIPAYCQSLGDVSKITYAYWAYPGQIISMKKYSRVNHNTLRKRMRDQMAQQIFTGKS